MTPAHAAASVVLRESLVMLRDALDGLPVEAMDWCPVPGTNSMTVLVTHSITSTRFWLGNGCGRVGSISAYRAGERARSFQESGRDPATLGLAIHDFADEAEAMLSKADVSSILATIDWTAEDPSEPVRTGIEALFRALTHLREHVGQVQLMRDLWLAHAAR